MNAKPHSRRAELAFGFRLDRAGFRLDVNLLLPARGVIALFGRSGCGKTTILRCVAGLERASGHCRLNGEVWQDDSRGLFLPTHRRPIGYVFQEPSLFPHLSVRRNLEYGFLRVPEPERQVSFDDVVRLLGVRHFLDRAPVGLSGGERQRVSIARALLTSPRLLLMDEPLSALDHGSRQEILPYLEQLHDTLKIPVLYVSHAADEVIRLADHLVLLQDGQALASGSTVELMTGLDPRLTLGQEPATVIDAVIRGHDERYQLSEIEIPGGRLAVPRIDRRIGARVRIRIYARDVSLTVARPGAGSIMNVLPVRVAAIEEGGEAQAMVRLDTENGDGTALIARIPCRSRDAMRLTRGMAIYAQIAGTALVD
jgi:molybdate transport system ATP-binding protein